MTASGQSVGRRRRSRLIEIQEIQQAAGILGVAQKAIEHADELAQRGSKTMGRALTRQCIREARRAADEAQRAINAEIEANRTDGSIFDRDRAAAG